MLVFMFTFEFVLACDYIMYSIMTNNELEAAKEMAIRAARQIGRKLKAHWGQVDYETKGQSQEAVTQLDRQTELFLAERFKQFDHRIGFRGEEFGTQRKTKLMWLVDPIDGTIHFIRGLPFCTTMIALIDDNQVVMGIIHDFLRDETYWAIKGQGAFKNEQMIKVSNHSLADGALISIETNLNNPVCLEPYLRIRQKIDQNGLSRLILTANSGFESAMVASGVMDARITFNGFGQDYDYAAPAIIIEEAGGIVRNIGTNSYDYTNYNFIAANPQIYAEITGGKDTIFP